MYFWFDKLRNHRWTANKIGYEKNIQHFFPSYAGNTPADFGPKASKMPPSQLMQDVTVLLSDRILEDEQRQHSESSATHGMVTSGCDCVVIRHYTRG